MIRWPLAALAGTSLALLLFWGLALLVTPPEAAIEVRERAMALNLAPSTAPPMEQVAERSAAPQATAPSAPPPVSAPPSLPPPAPMPDSTLSLPEASLPERPVEPSWENAELDSALPELAEASPTPDPTPEPAPAPEPEIQPETQPEAASTPADTAAPEGAAAAFGQDAASAADQFAEVVRDVGQATPTRREPPTYPRRAQRRGLEGHVVVEFLIRPDGRVKSGSIRVIEARPRRVFDEAATRAVAGWRFAADGRLRRARQRLEFQLR